MIRSGVPIRSHGGRIGDIAIYGQELNHTTWRLCKMNLAVRGIAGYLPPWFKRNPSLVVAELRDLECRRRGFFFGNSSCTQQKAAITDLQNEASKRKAEGADPADTQPISLKPAKGI